MTHFAPFPRKLHSQRCLFCRIFGNFTYFIKMDYLVILQSPVVKITNFSQITIFTKMKSLRGTQGICDGLFLRIKTEKSLILEEFHIPNVGIYAQGYIFRFQNGNF